MAENAATRITVRVQPNAGQNRVVGFKDGVLSLKIAAPPVKGKANRELIRFLSGILGVPGSSLTIEKGMTARKKVIAIRGLTDEQLLASLSME